MNMPENGDNKGGPQNVGKESDHDLLVRIYERQRAENERIDSIATQVAALSVQFATKIDAMEKKIDTLDERYVTHMEFWPVKTIVYAGVGIVLVAVLSAVVAMAITSRREEAAKSSRARGAPETTVVDLRLP